MKPAILRLFLFSFILLSSIRNYGQNNYQLTALSGTFTPLTGGTATTFYYDITPAINIGFTFRYNGINYTQVKASAHGFLTFNTSASSSWTNDLTNSASRPLLAPFWDLLDAGASGTKSYLLQGTAPNRIFTFEWLNCKTASWLDPFSFQVKLYETSNRIEFIYNKGTENFGYLSASIGLAFENIGSGNFVSLNNTGTSPTISSTIETKNINTIPAAGQIYRFTFIVKPEPTNHASNFTANIDNGNLKLSWTDAIGTQLPDGYMIMASTSNSFTNPTDGVAVTSDNNLSDGTGAVIVLYGSQSYTSWMSFKGMTAYYFRIYPFTNSGLYINYKTGGTIPSCQITTPVFSKQNHLSLLDGSGFNSAWGDFDKDGYTDLFLGNQIYKNNSGNGFTKITTIGTPGYDGIVHGDVVEWGDYDNDQDIDLFFTTKDNVRYWWGYTSKIYTNNGNSTFSENTSILPGLSNASEVWSDLNNDGHPDCILAGNQSTGNYEYKEAITKIYLNVNATSYVESGIALRGGQCISVADFNNDSYNDIIVNGLDINTIKHTTLYKNSRDNTFTEMENVKLPAVSESSVAWGDYNNDGYADILLAGKDYNDNVLSKIYKNNGDESFTEQTEIYLSGITDGTLDWGDYNNDGFLDILSAGKDSIGNYVCKIYKNNGGITFSIETELILSGYQKGSASWADYDNDGDLDFILMGYIWKNYGPVKNTKPAVPQNLKNILVDQNRVKLSWDNATDTETAAQGLSYNVRVGTYSGTYNIVSPMSDLSTGFNRIPDRGNSGSNGLILDYLPQGTYYWSVQTIDNGYLASGFSPEKMIVVPPLFSKTVTKTLESNPPGAWGDFDNDDDMDLIVGGNNIFINNGAGVFESNNPSNLFGGVKPIACGDYNNDGNLDFISGNIIYKNNGDNTVTAQTDISLIALTGGTSAWGDYDNDGDLDLIMTGKIDTNPVSVIYRNDGNNTFTEQNNIILKGSISSSWTDYDNDGDMDILVGNSIYKNNGNNTFSEQTGIKFEGGNYSSWGDIDGDGDLDVLITGNDTLSNPVTTIYRNEGNGTFVNLETDIRKTGDHALWGDCNNDGYMDILLSGESGYNISRVYINKGDNTYEEVFRFDNLGTTEIGWGDYNNDNNLDFFECGIPPQTDPYGPVFPVVNIWKNNVSVSNIPPATPSDLSSVQKGFDMLLSWEKSSDPNNPGGSLYYNIRIGTTPDGVDIMSPMSSPTGHRVIPYIGNTQCNDFAILKNLPAGTYYWSVQSIDQAYCGSQWAQVQPFIVTRVNPEFTFDTVCLGVKTSFTNMTVSSDSIASYIWDFGDNTKSSEVAPVHTYSNAGTFKVVLTAISVVNDSVSISHDVLVKDKPVVRFSSDIVCQGTATSLLNTTDTMGLIISTWHWDFGDSNTSGDPQPPPYGYLNAGEYNVKLDATASNGCSDSFNNVVSVGSYPVAAVTANAPLTFCSGDSVVLSVPENQDYSYQWMLNNTGITNANLSKHTAKISGEYSVEVMNLKGNCTATSSQVSVARLDNPATPLIVTENYLEGECPGENPVVLSVDQAVTEYSYQWKRNGTPISYATSSSYQGILPEGDYSVVVDLSGCKSESAVKTILYDDAPQKPLIYARGPTVWYLVCSNDSASLYKWYYNGSLIPDADNYLYIANQQLGKYNVSISNSKGCFTLSDTITIPYGTTGIEDADPFEGLKIYPNPTSGMFTVEMKNNVFGELDIRIFTNEGRQILNIKFEKTTEFFQSQIDLSGQGKGIYFINLVLEDFFANRKIVVE